MRDLVRQIVSGYKSIKLEGQDEGYVVFTGKEPDTKQLVSIKVLPRLLGNDPQIARHFRGLSQTIRQLNHPNIASVRKVGEESGLPYLITRAVEKGHPLAMKMDQPWAVDTAADVVMQVGQALDHAYKKGIVHGTLTPDNIIVEDDGQATVTDFGLSEIQNLVGVSVKEAASPYLAPERNEGSRADARADVYSLAAVLYSMLTKRNPQVVKGEVLPPSRFNPDVSAEMDAVVVRALDPDPANRYSDVRSFLAAFGAVSLAPAVKRSEPLMSTGRCSNCGARNQSGKFCRKCGVRLERPQKTAPAPDPSSVLDEPIQVTQVDVEHFEVGKGVEIQATTIAKPRTVATGELLDQFPEPLEMPAIDMADLWSEASDASMIAMPEPPSMPDIDWAEIAPPMPEVPTIEDVPASSEGD
jgi:serine/threonine protein kinase